MRTPKAAFAGRTLVAAIVSAMAALTFACGSKSNPRAGAGGASGMGGISVSNIGAGGDTLRDALVENSVDAVVVDLPEAGSAVDARAVDGAVADAAIEMPIADVVVDAAGACGDGACRLGQVCVVVPGHEACLPPLDAGGCGSGEQPVDSCSAGDGTRHHPACYVPAPTPLCHTLPAGCTDFCSCMCAPPAHSFCFSFPGHFVCSTKP